MVEAALYMITCTKGEQEEQEKHLLSLWWVNSRHSCTTAPYSSSPFPFYHSQAVVSNKKTWKHQREGVMDLSKLKHLATARPASGVSNVLTMQNAHSCPFLRCSKRFFSYLFSSFFLTGSRCLQCRCFDDLPIYAFIPVTIKHQVLPLVPLFQF